MPELPEVETIKAGLARLIVGKKIQAVDFDWPKGFPNDPALVKQFLIGSTIKSVDRRAKVILIRLDNNYSLIIHLKMTGQLIYFGNKTRFGGGHPSSSLVGSLPDKSTRVTISFSDKSKLYFNDQRKFGWVKLLANLEIANIDFFKKLGPEPLSQDFTLAGFKKQLARRKNSSIKAAILDQSVLAGVGNIYADESLWLAKIHPATLSGSLSDAQIKSLRQAIIDVLKISIKNGGSTDRNYVDAEGNKGNYLTFANVFRLDGQSCKRCGTTIIKTRVAARGTHLCPVCQKLKS